MQPIKLLEAFKEVHERDIHDEANQQRVPLHLSIGRCAYDDPASFAAVIHEEPQAGSVARVQ